MHVLTDDDVVVHGNPERARDGDDRLGHLDVGARGGRVATGVIVHEDDGTWDQADVRNGSMLSKNALPQGALLLGAFSG